MTSYNPSVPLNSDSPSNFPAQSQANFTRLKEIIEIDHQFNLTKLDNDGYHNLIHMTVQAPTGPLSDTGRMYVKSSGGNINAFYMDEAEHEYQMTPTMPIRAAVSFEGKGALGDKTMRSSFNVKRVEKTGEGEYTVHYDNTFPDANYIAVITGMRTSSDTTIFGNIRASGTITNSISTTFIKIVFSQPTSQGPDAVDCTVGNVIIVSVT